MRTCRTCGASIEHRAVQARFCDLRCAGRTPAAIASKRRSVAKRQANHEYLARYNARRRERYASDAIYREHVKEQSRKAYTPERRAVLAVQALERYRARIGTPDEVEWRRRRNQRRTAWRMGREIRLAGDTVLIASLPPEWQAVARAVNEARGEVMKRSRQ